ITRDERRRVVTNARVRLESERKLAVDGAGHDVRRLTGQWFIGRLVARVQIIVGDLDSNAIAGAIGGCQLRACRACPSEVAVRVNGDVALAAGTGHVEIDEVPNPVGIATEAEGDASLGTPRHVAAHAPRPLGDEV